MAGTWLRADAQPQVAGEAHHACMTKPLLGVLQVLAALSVRGGVGSNSHVPYRDSRLTQLLWEGLRSVDCLLPPLRLTRSCVGSRQLQSHRLPAASSRTACVGWIGFRQVGVCMHRQACVATRKTPEPQRRLVRPREAA